MSEDLNVIAYNVIKWYIRVFDESFLSGHKIHKFKWLTQKLSFYGMCMYIFYICNFVCILSGIKRWLPHDKVLKWKDDNEKWQICKTFCISCVYCLGYLSIEMLSSYLYKQKLITEVHW